MWKLSVVAKSYSSQGQRSRNQSNQVYLCSILPADSILLHNVLNVDSSLYVVISRSSRDLHNSPLWRQMTVVIIGLMIAAANAALKALELKVDAMIGTWLDGLFFTARLPNYQPIIITVI